MWSLDIPLWWEENFLEGQELKKVGEFDNLA